MSTPFIKLIDSVLKEHKGDESKDQKLKKTFKKIVSEDTDVDKKVEKLFKAVQRHLKASGQQQPRKLVDSTLECGIIGDS